jgi:hypothetical protein
MKQNQLLSLPVNQHSRHFIRPSFIVFAAIFLLMGCNSKSKENKAIVADSTIMTPTDSAHVVGGGPKAFISTFYKYKIAKGQIDFSYTKLTLEPVLDNLADPTTISLYGFPERAAGVPLVGTPFRAKQLTDPAAAFGTMGIMIGNNEILLSDFDWTTTDYLILEPTRIIDNFGFNVTAYHEPGGGLPPVLVPPTVPTGSQSKPSPPAPPAFLPAAEKQK